MCDGKEVREKHVIYEPTTGWQEEVYPLNDIKIMGSDGKKMDAQMLPQLLKAERPVLCVVREQKIDPTCLKVIKKDTPILILFSNFIP